MDRDWNFPFILLQLCGALGEISLKTIWPPAKTMDFGSLKDILFHENVYIYQVFLVIFLALLIDFLQRRVSKRLLQHVEKTKNEWDDALVHAWIKPVSIIIWSVGIALAADIIHKAAGGIIFAAVGPIRDTAIIAALAWFLLRLIKRGEANLKRKEQKYDETTIDAISKLLRVSVIIKSVLVILQTLGYSISGVLAFGGVGGVAEGFAARDLLANFFGGLMIYMDRPFNVGDWVRSPDREIEGTVEEIGWRMTKIRTFDKRPLYVPNSVFSNIAVENPSRMQNRRIKETIGIRYEDAPKMAVITEKVKDMLKNHPDIDTDRTLMVNFITFAPSSLNLFIYTFTKTTKWVAYHEIKQNVLLKIIEIIENEAAEFAFPTSTVHLADQDILKNIEPGN